MDTTPSQAELEEFRATVRKFATGALAAKAAHWDPATTSSFRAKAA